MSHFALETHHVKTAAVMRNFLAWTVYHTTPTHAFVKRDPWTETNPKRN